MNPYIKSVYMTLKFYIYERERRRAFFSVGSSSKCSHSQGWAGRSLWVSRVSSWQGSNCLNWHPCPGRVCRKAGTIRSTARQSQDLNALCLGVSRQPTWLPNHWSKYPF